MIVYWLYGVRLFFRLRAAFYAGLAAKSEGKKRWAVGKSPVYD
jgi:hypothetical protein